MSWIHPNYNKLSLILLISGMMLMLAAPGNGAKKKGAEVMNEAELQVRVHFRARLR